MFNPHIRRPVQVPKNRRVLHLVPAPQPQKRNEKIVVLRSRKLDDVVAFLMLALITASFGFGMVVSAFRIAERTTGSGLELLLLLVGVPLLVTGARFVYKATRAWKDCANFDDKLDRQRESLASVIRPIERKLPVPFHDWMQ